MVPKAILEKLEPISFVSSVSEALFALSFSFLSERFFSGFYFVHAKAALACPYSRNE